MEQVISYLEGLLLGRGHMYRSQHRILIEFPHKNPTLPGIAHCPQCGWLATGFSELKCKNPECRRKVDASVKKIYEQHVDTKKSLINAVIPFIADAINCDTKISTGTYSTHLVIDFPTVSKAWNRLNSDFPYGHNHHDFHIPENISRRNRDSKREFVNGLLDTAGFVNAGGWLPRDGNNGHGRMRLYFQIVRNWNLVVEIDNFLRRDFGVPIQTIDWGHPNMRSAGGSEGRAASTSREHQIKIFPEHMTEFGFRITCKRLLFAELLDHNQKVGFDRRENWFPPRVISDSRRKPTHTAEGDFRLPVLVRRHFDAFWQINLALGCEYLQEVAERSANPEVFALTGDTNSNLKLRKLRARLAKVYEEKTQIARADLLSSAAPKQRNTPEYETYEPLRKWLETHLRMNYDVDSVAWITADQNLTNYLSGLNSDALNLVENLEDLRIRPDIVGVIPSTGELAFIESKVTNLNLREVGQLLGYCLVAQPRLAFLISTKLVDEHLRELIAEYPELVEFGNGNQIRLLRFNTTTTNGPEGL